MADDIRKNGGDADMRIEFLAFCKMLLLLLKSGKTSEVIAELENIVQNSDQ